jgi:hypothetical protein
MAGRDIDAVIRDLKIEIQKTAKRKIMMKLGTEMAKMIQIRTRLGYGVSRDGAQRRPLKRLSPSYVEFRKATRHRLSPYTSPKKSNLTYSGRLLGSLSALRAKDGSVSVGPKGSRNIKVHGYVSEKRPYLFLSDLEIKKLRREYDLIVQKIAKEFR